MHKVHVTVYFQQDLADVFTAITDHRNFLSGGGLTCRIIRPGISHENGLGAIRAVSSKKYTLIEEISAFIQNESYDYVIKEITPPIKFRHHNGWIQFTEESHKKIRVEWHSHFTFTTPVIGHLIGWMVKRQLEKIFLQRLNYMKKQMD